MFRHYDPDSALCLVRALSTHELTLPISHVPDTGHITFHAFVSRVMPRDYSEPTYWDRRADEIVRSVVHKPPPSSPHLERPQRGAMGLSQCY